MDEQRRDRYRDNDDERPLTDPATRNDAYPRGPSENDRQRSRSDAPDQYDEDLARDNRRGREGEGMSDLARDVRSGAAGFAEGDRPADMDAQDDRSGWRSHARKGQAESPVEQTHNEPPRHKEGHR